MPPSDAPTADLDPFGRFLHRAAVVVAGVGGLALLLITALTIASVIGREVFDVPIPGDFELVEIGCAIAIFAFFPYCQMVRGNVIVDLFTTWTSVRTRAVLDLIANLAFMMIAAALTWRTALGAAELMRYGEETMVLRVPLWWGCSAGALSFGFLTIVCAYTAWRSLIPAWRAPRPVAGGQG
ncbi:MAG: TRAP transporter small permease [Rhodospirillales bacterium]|nr:TRAP transporter small permease [Rhodospirillales bacterium]